MHNKRLLANSVALCVPTVLLLAAGICFVAVDLPRIEQAERERVRSESREVADELKAGMPPVDFTWVYGEGVAEKGSGYEAEFPATMVWKDWRKTGYVRKSDIWGYVPRKDGTLVWVRDGTIVRGRETAIETFDYRTVVLSGGIAGASVLILVTALAVRYFRSYVKSRDDYLAATAHDLSTPLAAMRYSIDRDPAEAKVLNERLIRIVDNIKDFLRLGGRRRRPESEPFDLVKAYSEAYALFREDYRDIFDGRDVEFDAPEDGLFAKGDETLAVQILWNILGNDLKYAAPHGAVRVSMRREGNEAVVEFTDEGQGMTPRQMKRAFDRYYRAKTVLESGKGGFGIGLCTSREAARAMGGELSVAPNAPKGCIFTLRLPRALEI